MKALIHNLKNTVLEVGIFNLHFKMLINMLLIILPSFPVIIFALNSINRQIFVSCVIVIVVLIKIVHCLKIRLIMKFK